MELLVQKYLRSGKTLEDLEKDFGIKFSKCDSLVVLNYDQCESPKVHPIVMECRSLILENITWDLIAMSFKRFFNYGECLDLTKDFDYSNAFALEKVDGSLITVVHYHDKWYMSTRKSIEGKGNVGIFTFTFRDLFDRTVSQYDGFWDKLDKDNVYVFELVSPESKVVKPYMNRALYILTIRNTKNDFKELEYEKTVEIAEALGVNIPQRYSFKNIEDLIQMSAGLEALDEGFVCVDYTGEEVKRIKVKNPKYVAIAHLKESSSSSMRAIMQMIIAQEHEEFLSYFPEFTSIVNGINAEYLKYKNELTSLINEAISKKGLERKAFAMYATKTINPSLMFLVYDGKVDSFKSWTDSMMKQNLKLFPKKILEVLKIKDMEFE